MQRVLAVLFSLACLALTGGAASMKKVETHTATAISLLMQSSGPGKVQTKSLVNALDEVAKGLQTEDKVSMAVGRTSKGDCKKTHTELKMSLAKSKRTMGISNAEYEKNNAQARALQAELAEVKSQISKSNSELDSLQARLKSMRKDKGLLKKSASAALRQVEMALEKTYLWEHSPHEKSLSSFKHRLAGLEKLSESLSLLQESSSHEERPAPTSILQADKQDVASASDAAQKGFNEEEKKVLDLIEVERKKLQDLEDNMQALQPSISNKLQQALEINRTLEAATRAMDRDNDLLSMGEDKCALIAECIQEQHGMRIQVTDDVQMAAKLIQHMDTALFLAEDIQGLKKNVPSLPQVVAESAPKSHKDASSTASPPLSLLQEEDDLSDESSQETTEDSGSETGSEGPFDSVTQMISGLITDLKAEANEEVNQHQFCQDSLGNNRRDRIDKKMSIDTLTSSAKWATIAITRLDDDLKYCDNEIKRLEGFKSTQSEAAAAEKKRINKEFAEHKLANEVIEKSVVILEQLCDLSLVQQQKTALRRTKQTSRFHQCAEAADLLNSAHEKLEELEDMTHGYLEDFEHLSERTDEYAEDSLEDRNAEKTSAKAARAQRVSELATAKKDIREAQKELKLIDDAKKELEHSCSHVETREERMAKRQEEIKALKEALKVLEGEGIPV